MHNKRGTIEDGACEASVLGTPPEPQSPSEARLDAAIDEALDFAAYRVFETLLGRLTPLVVLQAITPEEIIGVLTSLRDEYKERYEAHRGAS